MRRRHGSATSPTWVECGFRYRIDPTPEQVVYLAKTFGCARFVYNHALAFRQTTWHQVQRSVSYGETSARLTQLKHQPETAWLQEVSCVPLQQALRHLNRAHTNFFAKRARTPRPKTKRGRQSAEFTKSAFRWDGHQLTLAKCPGPIDIRWSRPLPSPPSTVTVSKDPAGRYFVSFRVRRPITPLPPTPQTTGLDLGLQAFVTTAQGDTITPPRCLARRLSTLACLQRAVSRKQTGSKNRQKACRRVARLHAQIADARRDFLHQLSTRLIRDNQTISAESLRIQNLLRHPTLSRAIADAGWGEFLRQLEYKARWYGRTFVQLDPWFPSSKQCSTAGCGFVLKSLALSRRQWTCPRCHTTHQRDLNAALNLQAAGLAVSACGGTVRLKASGRQQVPVKQETPLRERGIPRSLGQGGSQQSQAGA